ncbi:MAG TPA: hypothetical protein VKG01_02090 [Thermoanaerobaculia bacterium]|nr:hypothetical protein [Thermoanaerobaculia bacterium]
MISILVVGEAGGKLDALEAADPSVEVLFAHGIEEALEKLGRNRRIDALILSGGPETEAMVQAIREDNPAHPPIFVPAGLGLAIPHTTPIEEADPTGMLHVLKGKLEA